MQLLSETGLQIGVPGVSGDNAMCGRQCVCMCMCTFVSGFLSL